jgi:hypothetical protein
MIFPDPGPTLQKRSDPDPDPRHCLKHHLLNFSTEVESQKFANMKIFASRRSKLWIFLPPMDFLNPLGLDLDFFYKSGPVGGRGGYGRIVYFSLFLLNLLLKIILY